MRIILLLNALLLGMLATPAEASSLFLPGGRYGESAPLANNIFVAPQQIFGSVKPSFPSYLVFKLTVPNNGNFTFNINLFIEDGGGPVTVGYAHYNPASSYNYYSSARSEEHTSELQSH